jgi:hypothetical protein
MHRHGEDKEEKKTRVGYNKLGAYARGRKTEPYLGIAIVLWSASQIVSAHARRLPPQQRRRRKNTSRVLSSCSWVKTTPSSTSQTKTEGETIFLQLNEKSFKSNTG